MHTDRLPSLSTLPSSCPSSQLNGLRNLGAEVIRRALVDATTPWLRDQTREEARDFLTRRGHSGLVFWAHVLDIDAELIREHARELIATYDEAHVGQDGDDQAA